MGFWMIISNCLDDTSNIACQLPHTVMNILIEMFLLYNRSVNLISQFTYDRISLAINSCIFM